MLNAISFSNRRSTPLRPRSVERLLPGRPLNYTVSVKPDGGYLSCGSTDAWLLDPDVPMGFMPRVEPLPAPKRDEGSVQSGEPSTSDPHPADGDGGVEDVGDGSGETSTSDPRP